MPGGEHHRTARRVGQRRVHRVGRGGGLIDRSVVDDRHVRPRVAVQHQRAVVGQRAEGVAHHRGGRGQGAARVDGDILVEGDGVELVVAAEVERAADRQRGTEGGRGRGLQGAARLHRHAVGRHGEAAGHSHRMCGRHDRIVTGRRHHATHPGGSGTPITRLGTGNRSRLQTGDSDQEDE